MTRGKMDEDLEGSTEDAEFDKRHGYEEMVKSRGNRGREWSWIE